MTFSEDFGIKAAFVTYKKGAIICLFQNTHKLLQDLQRRYLQLRQLSEHQFIYTGQEFVIIQDILYTAESLSQIYLQALAQLNITTFELDKIVFANGPGSFTGLRIGAAFINGLMRHISKPICLIPCDFETDLSFANLSDLTCIISNYQLNKFELCSKIIPNYGKEPGPVLKSREVKQN